MIDALKSHFPGFLDPTNLVTVVSDLSPISKQMQRSRRQHEAQAVRRQAPSKHTTPHNLATERRRPKKYRGYRGVSCNTANHISWFVALMWQGMLEVSPLSFPRILLSTSLTASLGQQVAFTTPASDLANEMAISTNPFGPLLAVPSRAWSSPPTARLQLVDSHDASWTGEAVLGVQG